MYHVELEELSKADRFVLKYELIPLFVYQGVLSSTLYFCFFS